MEVEAGHRCAVTTCRATSGLEIHHIVPWAKVKAHEFDNLILLCGICHARATKGEIDRKAVRAYKANLGILSGRYGDLERRVLDHFVRGDVGDTIVIDKSHEILLSYLLEDGLLKEVGPARGALWLQERDGDSALGPRDGDILLGPIGWRLTERGMDVVTSLRAAVVLD